MSKYALGNLLELKRGQDLTKNDMCKGTYPVVGSNGIIGMHNVFNVKAPCITVGRSGTVGAVHYYNENCWAHNTCLYVSDFKNNNPLYLYYLLKNIDLTKVATSTGVPTLNRNFVYPITTTATANLDEQNNIANILGAIDEKIENNNAISAKLESLAKTIYDYWFLQFEFPNEDGKPYKSSGGKMVWNEELKREIPEGWEVIHLSDIATIKTDGINPMDNPTLEYIHYSIPAFDETHFPVKELGESINSGKYIVPENAILVSKLNPQFKRIWDPVECGDNCICSTEFIPFVPKDKYRGYLYSVLNSDPFQQYMIACSSSSTGSRKRMQPELCGSFPFASPQKEDPIIAKMSSLISGILMMNRKIVIETQQLTSLRDFLLPLLMNGQVTFKDKEASEEE